MFCNCCLQELKVQEQFWVHMNGILRNGKILPAPSGKKPTFNGVIYVIDNLIFPLSTTDQ